MQAARLGLLSAVYFLACLLALLSGAAAQDAERQGTDLSCAIIIWGNQDYEWNVTSEKKNAQGQMVKNYTSHCMAAVRNARQRCGGSSLNFVVTHFWKFTSDKGDPGRFCYKTNVGDDQVAVQCTDLVDWYPENQTVANELIYRFYKGMKGCFITAIWEGFTTIKITPHLDDGTGGGGWRNVLRLNPKQKLFGYSYSDIMLWPLARAINESVVQTNTTDKIKVYFTLQGEMNLALASFPNEWGQTLWDAKWRIAGPDQERQKLVKVGVSMNFNKLCGSFCWVGANAFSTAAVADDVLKAINMTAYKELVQTIDFLGVSNYPEVGNALNGGFWPMESSAMALSGEMSGVFGFSLQEFIGWGKEFHLSEFGIGGGRLQSGDQMANNLQELGDFTFFGMFGQYGHYPDPWQRADFKAFRKTFYSKAIQWLANGGGPTYKVSGAYLWSMSSWDVAGLYWASTSDKGTYYDEEVCAMIRDWNDNRKVPGG